jgi:hypothetical protein
MSERAWIAAAAVAALAGCRAHGQSSTPRAVTRAQPVTVASRSVVNEARFPARGCTPSAPVVQGFVAQTAPLDALETAAELGPDEPVTAFEHGALRGAWPSAWWPSRVDARDFTAFRLLTGDDEDVVSVYIGDRPAFRAPGGHEFRLVNGGTLIRGTLSRQDRRWRLEALALLPCSAPRHAHFLAQSTDPRVIARVARALRALRVTREPAALATAAVLDPSADRPRLEAMTASLDPSLRAWLLAALAARELRAKYPLATDHPRADQELTARVRGSLQGVPAELWLSISAPGGRAASAHVFNEAAKSQGEALSRTLAAAGCTGPSLTIAQDGVALRCAGETELRGAVDDRDGASSLSGAINRALAVRGFLRRWSARSELAWGYPSTLCAQGASAQPAAPVVVSAAGSVITARVGRCFLAQQAIETDSRLSPLVALAVEGACAEVAEAPWSTGLRAAGRFGELGAQRGQGECRYTLALRGGRGWVVSANDAESATGPVGQGLSMGVDRAAIARAVGVTIELAAMSAGRREALPEGVTGTVLSALSLDQPGTARARDALRWWYALGGVEGALPVAVMEASATATDRVRVVFSAWTLDVTRGASGWVVSGIERTRW